MQDFASAAMVRLLVRALRAHGLPPPAGPPSDGSHVPLAYKRAVVQAVLQHGGPGLLLQLALRVDLLTGDPVHQALVSATSVSELLARWQRLERYVHARHQVTVLAQGAGWVELYHHARPGHSQPPLAPESLAVVGVLAGASLALGTADLQAQLLPPDGAAPPALEMAAALATAARSAQGPTSPWAAHCTQQLMPWLQAGGHPGRTANALGHWRLVWRDTSPQSATPATTAAVPPGTLCDALPWPPVALQLARQVLRDPAGSHTVDALAHHAGQPRRSLQRALAAHGLSCRSIVTEARARAAAHWLLASAHGLAEIGFACGFADQPHFTREFARQVGMTPARYRQAFSPAPP